MKVVNRRGPFTSLAGLVVATGCAVGGPSHQPSSESPAAAGGAQTCFEQIVVEPNFEDGYWVDSFDVDGDFDTDVIASGLAQGKVVWYENPGTASGNSGEWKKRLITTVSKPVAMVPVDLDGDGFQDLVLSYDYGGCFRECKPQDGTISWLRNPGRDGYEKDWKQFPIGELVATHRLQIGNFTGAEGPELMAIPIVGGAKILGPVEITLYRPPSEGLLDGKPWTKELVDNEHFRVVHEDVKRKYAFSEGGSPLDSLILASAEGITWLRYEEGKWQRTSLGTGDKTEFQETGFLGSGAVDIGKSGVDPFAHMLALEPLHGNIVAAYHKSVVGHVDRIQWTRKVIDVFGKPNLLGESSGHVVKAGDFDADGVDEFLAGFRGPDPYQGVYLYRLVSEEKMIYEKARISEPSVSLITLADFNGDNRQDFASIGYRTPGYFLADIPKVIVFLNASGDSGCTSKKATAAEFTTLRPPEIKE